MAIRGWERTTTTDFKGNLVPAIMAKAIQEVVPNKTLGRHGMFNNSSTVGQKSIVFRGRGVAMRGVIEELFFCFKSLYRSIYIYIPL